MTDHILPVEGKYNKRQKVITAIVEDALNGDEDDIDMDTIGICNIIDGQQSIGNGRNDSSATIRALGETIRSTLLEINEIREHNRERRHKELLDVLNKVINNETHQIVKTTHPCKIDNLVDHQENISDHCRVEELINETTESNRFVSRPENVGKASSVNALRTQACLTAAPSCPTQNTEMVVEAKKDTNSIGDLKLMRAKMLEMQRKKMEDRVRKKRDCILVKNL